MNIQQRRINLRTAILKTVEENGGDLPVGIVRAVLGEAEHILMHRSDDVAVNDLPDRTRGKDQA